MGDGTEQNPYTREDVLRLIEENGGTAKGLDLSGEHFQEGINLQGLNLKRASLLGAHLKKANLKYADLERANLVGADLKKAVLSSTHLVGANLAAAQLEGADLALANLDGTFLRLAELEGAYFVGVRLSSDTHLQHVDWGNYILGEERNGQFRWAADTYRQLKTWYTEHGMYDIAGVFYFREMTANRKELGWWPNPFPRAWSKFISLICGYGERPLRVIASAAVVVFGLALIYFAIGTLTPNSFLNSLYYSAVSFTAVGYGSWVKDATGWVKGLGAFEAFAGVFMIALFLITFVRKMTR